MANPLNKTISSQFCFTETISKGDSPWQMENPMIKYVPFFATELACIIFIIQFFTILLKLLHQSRFVAQLLGSLLISVFAFGPIYARVGQYIFPRKMSTLLETFSSMGITYYMFLVGLEMNLSTLRHIEKKSLTIALAGVLLPFGIGAGLYFLPVYSRDERRSNELGAVFWATALTVTSFSDLARILSHLKLLHTELGKTALSSAIINEIATWCLFATAIILFERKEWGNVPLTTLPIIGFVIICYFVFRPGIAWMTQRTKEKAGKFTDTHIYFVLIGVAVCGIITDACGTHAMVGGFLFGLIIPNGEFSFNIMERIEEFVTGIMLPSYIVYSGYQSMFISMCFTAKLPLVLLITIVATLVKILSTALVCLYFGMSLRVGISLGSLMNTKGVMAFVILNKGRSLRAIDGISVSIMMCSILVMTSLVGPIFFLAHKNARRSRKYKRRTIQRSNQDTELRILTCIHSIGNLSGIINLLEVSNATRKSPVCVFAVQLAELTSRSSDMLIVYDIMKTINNENPEQDESDRMINAFRSYQDRNKEVLTVQFLTAVSSFTSIHEEIFDIAKEKVVAMILVPFHKQPTVDGELRGGNDSIRAMNQHLLAKAPCSVGILIDRGLGSVTNRDFLSRGLNFVVLFIGGPDDREALTYAWRTAGKQGVTLTVLRFLPNNKKEELDIAIEDENNNEGEIFRNNIKLVTEKELDDEFINEFRFKSMYQSSISYKEKMVNCGEEIIDFIRTMDNEFDLYIIGRGKNVKSPLIMGLSEQCDNPELGPIGDSFVSSNFIVRASVLVVQQYVCSGLKASSLGFKTKFGQKKWASPILNPDYEAFINIKKKDY